MLDSMKMKEMLLEELLEDLNSQDGDKLKPKAAMIAVGHSEDPSGEMLAHEVKPGIGGDEDDEEDLKALLEHYAGQ